MKVLLVLLAMILFISGCTQTTLYPDDNDCPVISDALMSDVQKSLHIARSINYQIEYGSEDYWQNPDETFIRGYGDCEDLAIMFHWYLKEQGIESMVVVGKVNSSDTLHAWVEIPLVGESKLLVDPTCSYCFPQCVKNNKKYVEVRSAYARNKILDYQQRNGYIINSTY